ncbi:MAG: hypothetical protein QOI47_1253 [Actinomycetota bacterium]|jgi:GAF domain-containing protein|nr:hypothetical protein [Actinomycetota bacterium]
MSDDEVPLLTGVLAELAGLAAEPFDVGELVHRVSERAARALDCDGAIVLLSIDGETLEAAGSSAGMLGVDKLLALTTTPCHTAMRSGKVVLFPAEGASPQFAEFAALADHYGVLGTMAVPLRHRDAAIGVVCLVRTREARFGASTIEAAQQLAAVIASLIVREKAHRASVAVTEQLQHALDVRVVIEQAKGMVAAELGITVDEALDRIRPFARRRQLELAQVAADIVSRTLPITLLRAEV